MSIAGAFARRDAVSIDWKGALLRGRYACAVAAMEDAGIPVNVTLLDEVVGRWADISRRPDPRDRPRLWRSTTARRSSASGLNRLSNRTGIPWPRLPSGVLALDSDTFHDMAQGIPRRGAARRAAQSDRHDAQERRFQSATMAAPGLEYAHSHPRRRVTSRARQSFSSAHRNGCGISFSQSPAMRCFISTTRPRRSVSRRLCLATRPCRPTTWTATSM